MEARRLIPNRELRVFDALQSVIDALGARYPSSAEFRVDGGIVTLDGLIAKLKAAHAYYDDLVAADVAYRTARAAKVAQMPHVQETYDKAVAILKADLGPNSSELAAFGIAPRKPRTPLTSAQRVVAEAKRAATRRARGIVGKRQREAITLEGTFGVNVVSPNGSTTVVQEAAPRSEPGTAPPAPQVTSAPSALASGSTSGAVAGVTGQPLPSASPAPSANRTLSAVTSSAGGAATSGGSSHAVDSSANSVPANDSVASEAGSQPKPMAMVNDRGAQSDSPRVAAERSVPKPEPSPSDAHSLEGQPPGAQPAPTTAQPESASKPTGGGGD